MVYNYQHSTIIVYDWFMWKLKDSDWWMEYAKSKQCIAIVRLHMDHTLKTGKSQAHHMEKYCNDRKLKKRYDMIL